MHICYVVDIRAGSVGTEIFDRFKQSRTAIVQPYVDVLFCAIGYQPGRTERVIQGEARS
jgi:hypothetical protein